MASRLVGGGVGGFAGGARRRARQRPWARKKRASKGGGGGWSSKRGVVDEGATSTDGGGLMAVKRDAIKHNAATAANMRGLPLALAGGAEQESYSPHFQLMVELLMP